MIIPLACISEPISVSSRQAPTYTLKVKWRLPAVRVSCVLAAPDRRIGSVRTGLRSSDVGSWWGSSGTVARRLATVWSSVVETQRVWSQTSYQTLQRVGSTLLRSASLDKLLSAAGAATDSPAQVEEAPDVVPPTMVQYQASLSRFVAAASPGEVDEACMLADLSNMSYDVTQINEHDLAAKHQLKLVKLSLAANQPAAAVAAAPAAAGAVEGAFLAPAAAAAAGGAPTVTVLAAGPAATAAAADEEDEEEAAVVASPRSPRVSAFTVLPASVYVDDAAAADDDDILSSPRMSDQAAMTSASETLAAVAAAAVSRIAAADAVAAAAAAAGGHSAAVDGVCDWAQEPSSPDSPIHPADWFVCDSSEAAAGDSSSPSAAAAEEAAPTRYFIFQGSITLNHWKINLTIDPIPFEGRDSGVKVHRGVYMAAQQLYDTFVPMVQEHLARSPKGRFVFAGHSLGGSLATVLMLLLVHRGVLPADNVSTVHTFGAPAVFCEGASGIAPTGGPCAACALPCEHKAASIAAFNEATAAAAGSAAPQQQQQGQPMLHGVLEQLGLRPEVIRNVIMTRDIVPRAFVCDYTVVADVLKSWMPSFKEHMGLAPCKPHKVLYNFLGNVEVLHPPLSCGFVLPGEGHFMLPAEAALYKLQDPQQQDQQPTLQRTSSSSSHGGCQGSSCGCDGSSVGHLTCAALSPRKPTGSATTTSIQGVSAPLDVAPAVDPLGLTLGDAILAFMNSPHPLETLGEWRAYGPDGSISRFHNPANYTRALESVRDLTPCA